MKFYEMDQTEDYYHYKAIVRCQRDFVGEVRSSIALATKYNSNDLAISTIGLSGTIKGSQKYI